MTHLPLQTMAQAEAALQAYIPKGPTVKKEHYKLNRIRQLLQEVGNPHKQLLVIHIAGTSGKTSVAYFIRGMLQAAGMRTGLTVSPHIASITERIQINGSPISEAKFIEYFNKFLPLIRKSTLQPTYFEVLISFAYWVFYQEKVQYAVIETGLGGLLDSTNVADNPNKLCVISDIGFDHIELLGSTLPEIAAQKAGIIYNGNTVILQRQRYDVMRVVRDYAEQKNAHLVLPGTNVAAAAELPPFQQRNFRLAYAVYKVLQSRDNLLVLHDAQLADVARQQPPGRFEKWRYAGKTVYIDGAHNPQKLQALVQAVNKQGVENAAVLASFIKSPSSKLSDSLIALRPLASHLVIPEFVVVQDIGKQSFTAQHIAHEALLQGYDNVGAQPDIQKALRQVFSWPEQTVVITGSLYLVSHAVAWLQAKGAKKL